MQLTLTLTGLNKSGKGATFSGLAKPITIPVSAFDGTPAATLEIEGNFKPAPIPETAEERKARRELERKNKPKPTLAEQIAMKEAKIEKLRQKLLAEAAATGA